MVVTNCTYVKLVNTAKYMVHTMYKTLSRLVRNHSKQKTHVDVLHRRNLNSYTEKVLQSQGRLERTITRAVTVP